MWPPCVIVCVALASCSYWQAVATGKLCKTPLPVYSAPCARSLLTLVALRHGRHAAVQPLHDCVERIVSHRKPRQRREHMVRPEARIHPRACLAVNAWQNVPMDRRGRVEKPARAQRATKQAYISVCCASWCEPGLPFSSRHGSQWGARGLWLGRICATYAGAQPTGVMQGHVWMSATRTCAKSSPLPSAWPGLAQA